MESEYHSIARFAQTWGLVYLFLLFLGVLVYALWPGNRKKFKHAANLPLNDDDPTEPDFKS